MLRKVVIPAAGLGTRLLPATKEQPKEMLPVFARGVDGGLCVKPFLQVVFEKLHEAGFRSFCFVVGRGKRSIEDHFTLDGGFSHRLPRENKAALMRELSAFYDKITKSHIVFLNQPEPRGFGNAVFHAKGFTGNEPFLVHAGDDLILSEDNHCMRRLVEVFESFGADAVFHVQRVGDPRNYGVVAGERVGDNLYRVKRMEEKPLSPFSNLAAVAVYVFSPRLYDALEEVHVDVNGEVQLTDAIKWMIDEDYGVYALELGGQERRIDIGTPESYWQVLKTVREWWLCL